MHNKKSEFIFLKSLSDEQILVCSVIPKNGLLDFIPTEYSQQQKQQALAEKIRDYQSAKS
jgi:hypothetical protein